MRHTAAKLGLSVNRNGRNYVTTDTDDRPVRHPDSAPRPLLTYVSLSYRYLRLGMVALVGLIFVSVAIEVLSTPDRCFQGSISAYYYTPVQFIFVASLVAIGMCMIVLKGSNEWEDAFLNVAGLLAPIVALVPTIYPGSCSSVQPMEDASTAAQNVENNVLAYAILGAVALLLTWVARARVRTSHGIANVPAVAGFKFSLWLTSGIALLGVVVFFAARPFFIEWGHPISAITLFVFIIAVVCQNSIQKGRTAANTTKGYLFTNRYSTIGLLMIVLGVGIVVVGVRTGWEYWVLVVEATEIALFAVFWVSQTKDAEKKIPHLDDAVAAGVVREQTAPAVPPANTAR